MGAKEGRLSLFMDIWIVAAATGAGYLAKYWQFLSGEKNILLPDSSSLFPINRRSDIRNVLQQISERPLPLQKLARKWLDGDPYSSNKQIWDGELQEMEVCEAKNRVLNVGPLSTMPMICSRQEVLGENVDVMNGARLKSRRRYSMDVIRPVEAQMPLMVTDADRMIRRRSSSSYDPLVEGRSMKLLEKREITVGKGEIGQPGNGMLLLFTGIAIGVMANTVATESEVDKLNELIKKSLNLVSDLREELELKDKLTMKELSVEDNQLSRTNSLTMFSSEMVSSSYKPQLHFRSSQMTEIEAELEAELERLECNMNTPALERISDFVELDPEYEANVSKGDLKVNVANTNGGDYLSDTDDDKSGTMDKPTDDGNYVVSPWELTLLLHELIESRLYSRIKQLESKLDQSQTHTVESLHVTSLRDFELESSSTSDSPSLTLPSDGQRAWRLEDWTSSGGSNELGQTEDEDDITRL